MEPSRALVNFIRRVEGFKNTVYLDTAGKMTIGIGHLINGNRDIYLETVLGGEYDLSTLTLTDEQVEKLYVLKKKDLLIPLQTWLYRNKIELSQTEFDACCSFIFNLGPGTLKSSSFFKYILRGDHKTASERMLLWNKTRRNGKLQFDQGVMNRRIMEMNIFLTINPYDDIIIPEDKTRQSDRNYIRQVVQKYREEMNV